MVSIGQQWSSLVISYSKEKSVTLAVTHGDSKTKVQCMFFPPPNSFDITDTSAQGPSTTSPLTHIQHCPHHLHFDHYVSQLDVTET
jgi:hypothetical protein